MSKKQNKKSKKQNTKEVILISMNEVVKLTGISKSYVYKRMNLNKFPKPIRIGDRKVVWIKSEITEWVNDRILETRGAV